MCPDEPAPAAPRLGEHDAGIGAVDQFVVPDHSVLHAGVDAMADTAFEVVVFDEIAARGVGRDGHEALGLDRGWQGFQQADGHAVSGVGGIVIQIPLHRGDGAGINGGHVRIEQLKAVSRDQRILTGVIEQIRDPEGVGVDPFHALVHAAGAVVQGVVARPVHIISGEFEVPAAVMDFESG